jgi:hypothetical protein
MGIALDFPLPPSPALGGRPRPDSYILPPFVLEAGPSLPDIAPPLRKPMSLKAQRSDKLTLAAFVPPAERETPVKRLPMAIFEIALAYVLVNEGSTFTNDPSDAGGATKFGVTQGTLTSYLGRKATIADVQGLTQATVSDIYRKLYWTPVQGDSITAQAVATVVLDLAVLCGPATAVRMVQAAVAVTQDGRMGPMTLAAINKADPKSVVQSMSLAACGYFCNIVVRDTAQQKWLAGWQYRAHKMTRLLLA